MRLRPGRESILNELFFLVIIYKTMLERSRSLNNSTIMSVKKMSEERISKHCYVVSFGVRSVEILVSATASTVRPKHVY